MVDKCACAISGAEALVEYVSTARPERVVLIEDVGNGWHVTKYGPETFGLPTECRTIQSALEAVEMLMIDVRRQPDNPILGEIITDQERIVDALRADGRFSVEQDQE